MPSSTVRTFTDPDDYASSIRATSAALMLTDRGHFGAKLVRVDLHRVWMQQLSESLPRIAYFSILPGRVSIAFSALPGRSVISGGIEQDHASIVLRKEAQEYFHRTSAASCNGALSLPMSEFDVIGTALAGRDLTIATPSVGRNPTPSALARLRKLHEKVTHLAEFAPEIIGDPESSRGLEQELISAMVGCIATGEPQADRSAARQHAKIMRKFRREVEERPNDAVYIPELCTAIGTSERTLRVACHEQLGIGPKRYLLLRRMHLARRALSESTPNETTVTEIATRYGFWQLGRFAGEYKSLFGEAPSATLAAPERRSGLPHFRRN